MAPPFGAQLICDTTDVVRVDINYSSMVATQPDSDPVEQSVGPSLTPGPKSDISRLLAGRTADCQSRGHDIRVRASWFEERWGGWHERDEEAMLTRIWVDQRPASIVLRAEPGEHVSASLDLVRSVVTACDAPVANDGNTDERCVAHQFALGAVDMIEFAPQSAFPGPSHDVYVVGAQDVRLCGAFAAYAEGGPPPPGLTAPEAVPSPDAWKAWSEYSYRFDADNDGQIDDVAVISVDQYVLHGTVIAVFERDSVLTGRATAPWWGDLLTIAMGNEANYNIKRSPALKAAVWGGPLGLFGDTTIELLVVDGQTYAHLMPRWFSSYRPSTYTAREAMPPLEDVRPDASYQELVVRLLPGMKAAPLCRFSRRSQRFE